MSSARHFAESGTAPLALFFIQVVYMVSVIIFYFFARYRMVAVPLFCLSAGYGFYVAEPVPHGSLAKTGSKPDHSGMRFRYCQH
jgi:hypothetical protein